jgi:hypothetical protein
MTKNIFAKAAIAPVKATPAKKSDKVRHAIVGLRNFAAVDEVIKSLTAIKTTIQAEVKQAQLTYFIVEGMRAKRRPANFEGFEGDATASCELRVRSSASVLTPEEQELLTENSISFEQSDKIVETYIINPKYAADQDMLEKVSKALSKVAGLPEDFIQLQSHKVATASEKSIDEVFALTDVAKVTALLPIVTTLATGKAAIKSEDTGAAFKAVTAILNPPAKKAEETKS